MNLAARAICGIIAMLCLAGTAGPIHAQALGQNRDEIAYQVKPGDTLIGLSQRHMVRPDSYLSLIAPNHIANPDHLPLGSTIIIPTALLRSAPLEARVLAFRGAVSVSQAGSVSIGLPIGEGAALETGEDGFLTIGLADGSRLSLPSRTRLRVIAMRRYSLTGSSDVEIAIDKGRTEVSATPQRNSANRFRLRTPIAVSAVRGTVFRIGYGGDDDPSLTEVVEGKVAVNATTSDAQSLLPMGFGAAVARSGDLHEEKLLAPPSLLSPDAVQRGSDVHFAFAADPLAKAYHAQLARDAAFVDLMADSRAATGDISFANVPDGHFFLRAMAVAASGLEGLPQVTEFAREIRQLIAVPAGTKRGDYRFSWVTTKVPAASYRLQIFSQRDPGTPMIDETGLDDPALVVTGLAPGAFSWRVRTTSNAGTDSKPALEQSWTEFEHLLVP